MGQKKDTGASNAVSPSCPISRAMKMAAGNASSPPTAFTASRRSVERNSYEREKSEQWCCVIGTIICQESSFHFAITYGRLQPHASAISPVHRLALLGCFIVFSLSFKVCSSSGSFSDNRMLPFLMENASSQEEDMTNFRRVSEERQITSDESDVFAIGHHLLAIELKSTKW